MKYQPFILIFQKYVDIDIKQMSYYTYSDTVGP